MRSEEITEEYQRITRQILDDSRAELYMDQHYLALALGAFRYAVNTQMRGIGTDGEYLAVHPKDLASLYRENRLLVNRRGSVLTGNCGILPATWRWSF